MFHHSIIYTSMGILSFLLLIQPRDVMSLQQVTSHSQLIQSSTTQSLDRFGYQMAIGGQSYDTLVVSTYTAASVARKRHLRGRLAAAAAGDNVELHPNTVVNDDADPYRDTDGNLVDNSGSIYIFKQHSALDIPATEYTATDSSGNKNHNNWWNKDWWTPDKQQRGTETFVGETAPQWQQQCLIRAPYYSHTEKFGNAVSITVPPVTVTATAVEGVTMTAPPISIAVGAECHDQQGVCSGAVYVFLEDTSTNTVSWVLAQKILPPYQSDYQHFGSGVTSASHVDTVTTHTTTTSGGAVTNVVNTVQQWLLVGSPRDPPSTRTDSSGGNGKSGSVTFTGIGGVVYVYGQVHGQTSTDTDTDTPSWSLQHILSVDTILHTPYGYSGSVSTSATGLTGGHSGMGFGSDIISTVVPGASTGTSTDNMCSSFATVLALTGAVAFVNQSADTSSDLFIEVGAAYLYRYSCGEWTSDGVLANPDQRTRYTYFGHAVALDGTAEGGPLAYVSAHEALNTLGGRVGAVYVFQRYGGETCGTNCWRHTEVLTSPVAAASGRHPQFGSTVATGRGYLAVSAPLQQPVSNTAVIATSGVTYLYTRNGSGHQLVATLSRPASSSSAHVTTDGFGQSLILTRANVSSSSSSSSSSGDSETEAGVNILVGADFGSDNHYPYYAATGVVYSYRGMPGNSGNIRFVPAAAFTTEWVTVVYSEWDKFSLLFDDHPADMTLLCLCAAFALTAVAVGTRYSVMQLIKWRRSQRGRGQKQPVGMCVGMSEWKVANTCTDRATDTPEGTTGSAQGRSGSYNSWRPKNFLSLTSLITPQFCKAKRDRGGSPGSSGGVNNIASGPSSAGQKTTRPRRSPVGCVPDWTRDEGQNPLLFHQARGTETSVMTNASDYSGNNTGSDTGGGTGLSAHTGEYDADSSGDDTSAVSVGGRLLQGTAVRI